MKFRVLNSEVIFKGKVFNVRQDQVELPNGQQTRLDIVEHNDAVTLVPLDAQGRVWFVRQYRHAAGEVILELPAGVVEEDEPAEASAAREVREEIGMAAGKLRKIGQFYLAPGYTSEFMHVFLAEDLQDDPLQADDDEFLSIDQYSIEQVYQMVENGEINDAKTLAALLLARPFLLTFPG